MANLQCGVELENKKVTTPAMLADILEKTDTEDAVIIEESIAEGPIDVNLLMDLGFIKRTLDNLVSPLETQSVLDMAVEYIKQDTGKLLQAQTDTAKAMEARLTLLDTESEKVKKKLTQCQDKVTLLKETVTENQTKLKSVVAKDQNSKDPRCS